MLTRNQAVKLANKHNLLSSKIGEPYPELGEYDESIITALIEASRGDFHLKLEAAKKPTKQERQGFNDWKNPT